MLAVVFLIVTITVKTPVRPLVLAPVEVLALMDVPPRVVAPARTDVRGIAS